MRDRVIHIIVALCLCQILYAQSSVDDELSYDRRVVIELEHASYSECLSVREIEIIEKRLTHLLGQFIELSGFQDENGTYTEVNNNKFLKLFTTDAELYSDLHVGYTELSPPEYVSTVNHYFGDYGIDSNLEYAGLISIDRKNEQGEFSAHLAVQKVVYSRISPGDKRLFYKDGEVIYFDLFVLIDLKKNAYQIEKISNEELLPVELVVQQFNIPVRKTSPLNKTKEKALSSQIYQTVFEDKNRFNLIAEMLEREEANAQKKEADNSTILSYAHRILERSFTQVFSVINSQGVLNNLLIQKIKIKNNLLSQTTESDNTYPKINLEFIDFSINLKY